MGLLALSADHLRIVLAYLLPTCDALSTVTLEPLKSHVASFVVLRLICTTFAKHTEYVHPYDLMATARSSAVLGQGDVSFPRLPYQTYGVWRDRFRLLDLTLYKYKLQLCSLVQELTGSSDVVCDIAWMNLLSRVPYPASADTICVIRCIVTNVRICDQSSVAINPLCHAVSAMIDVFGDITRFTSAITQTIVYTHGREADARELHRRICTTVVNTITQYFATYGITINTSSIIAAFSPSLDACLDASFETRFQPGPWMISTYLCHILTRIRCSHVSWCRVDFKELQDRCMSRGFFHTLAPGTEVDLVRYCKCDRYVRCIVRNLRYLSDNVVYSRRHTPRL
jgi:hypothetical protein